MARGVLVAEGNGSRGGFGGLREVDGVKGWVAASRRLASGVVAHISHVAAPGFANGGELIRQSLDGGGVNAPAADGLSVGSDAGEDEVSVSEAVVAGLRSSRLAADHGDVIVQAHMAGAVVLGEQHALARQSSREKRGFGVGAEGDVKAF